MAIRNEFVPRRRPISDSCTVNNGGCDPNAFCSHDTTTNAVQCTCKTGYTNTGSGSTTVCKGNTSDLVIELGFMN